MSQTVYQVDAFTSEPFTGNPAGVCPLAVQRSAEWMQHVAAEINAPETAFLHPEGEGFELRWFTPTTEVELCGHATLASAHVLWETGALAEDDLASFWTRSGTLRARRRGEGIALDFPTVSAEAAAAPAELLQAVGGEPVWSGRTKRDYLLELADEAAVRALAPDFAALAALDCQGVIVTARAATAEQDFVSRYFAPRVGIDEDPVTGSAHCVLGPYWFEKLGREELVGYQASSRGGRVRVRASGNRTILEGRAVTVLQGELVGV